MLKFGVIMWTTFLRNPPQVCFLLKFPGRSGSRREHFSFCCAVRSPAWSLTRKLLPYQKVNECSSYLRYLRNILKELLTTRYFGRVFPILLRLGLLNKMGKTMPKYLVVFVRNILFRWRSCRRTKTTTHFFTIYLTKSMRLLCIVHPGETYFHVIHGLYHLSKQTTDIVVKQTGPAGCWHAVDIQTSFHSFLLLLVQLKLESKWTQGREVALIQSTNCADWHSKHLRVRISGCPPPGVDMY